MIVAGVVLLIVGLVLVVVALVVAGLDPLLYIGIGVDVVGAVLVGVNMGSRHRT